MGLGIKIFGATRMHYAVRMLCYGLPLAVLLIWSNRS